ncbi:hypothetical protein Tco_0041428 [Tanacetum coccineum]
MFSPEGKKLFRCYSIQISICSVLLIQERLAKNQQEFLDEYLPQWDENLVIQKKESGLEWENPFAAKRGENHTILHLSKEENDDDDLPYPKF